VTLAATVTAQVRPTRASIARIFVISISAADTLQALSSKGPIASTSQGGVIEGAFLFFQILQGY